MRRYKYHFPKDCRLSTAACLATPRVNIYQPYSYMTWHQHTPQSAYLTHDTERTETEGMWTKSTKRTANVSCSYDNGSTSNWLHNASSYIRTREYHKLQITPQNVTKCFNSLLCTVDELVLIGPLKACLHSFVVPQLLCVIKELLRKEKDESIKDQTFTNDNKMKVPCLDGKVSRFQWMNTCIIWFKRNARS